MMNSWIVFPIFLERSYFQLHEFGFLSKRKSDLDLEDFLKFLYYSEFEDGLIRCRASCEFGLIEYM